MSDITITQAELDEAQRGISGPDGEGDYSVNFGAAGLYIGGTALRSAAERRKFAVAILAIDQLVAGADARNALTALQELDKVARDAIMDELGYVPASRVGAVVTAAELVELPVGTRASDSQGDIHEVVERGVTTIALWHWGRRGSGAAWGAADLAHYEPFTVVAA